VSVSLIAWGIISDIRQHDSLFRCEGQFPSRCGCCGRFSYVSFLNWWMSIIRVFPGAFEERMPDFSFSGLPISARSGFSPRPEVPDLHGIGWVLRISGLSQGVGSYALDALIQLTTFNPWP
jgi:hypothetical protein